MGRTNESPSAGAAFRALVDKLRSTLRGGDDRFGIHDRRPLRAPLPPVAHYRETEAWVQLPESFSAEELALAIDRDVSPLPQPEGRVVFQERKAGNYACNVFHHTGYVRETWGRFLEVLEFVPEGADDQDLVVMRRT